MGTNRLWYVGVGLEIVSTMSGTIGKQLIRLSEQRKHQNPRLSALTFQTGILVNTVCGPLIDMAAYSFAAQSMIAPFGGLDVVWNALLAPWLLNESLTPRRTAGCVLVVTGTVMAGCFGNHHDAEYSLEHLEETLVNQRVLIYFACFLLWFCFNRFYLMGRPAGSALRGISLGCTAGTIAGNMFCVKAAIELIETSIREQDGKVWLHWLPYITLIGAAFFALTNVVYMTKGLQEYEALFMVTIYEGSMIVSGCVSGAVVLLDLKGLEPWRVCLYGLSVLVVVAGMCVIFSQERMSHSSLAAGSASIEQPEGRGRARTKSANIFEQLQERTLHASCSPLPELPKGVSHCSLQSADQASSPKGASTVAPAPLEGTNVAGPTELGGQQVPDHNQPRNPALKDDEVADILVNVNVCAPEGGAAGDHGAAPGKIHD